MWILLFSDVTLFVSTILSPIIVLLESNGKVVFSYPFLCCVSLFTEKFSFLDFPGQQRS